MYTYTLKVKVKLSPDSEFSEFKAPGVFSAKAILALAHSYKLQGGVWEFADYQIFEEGTGRCFSPEALCASTVRDWVKEHAESMTDDLVSEFASYVASHSDIFPPEEELQWSLLAFLAGVSSGMKQVFMART